MVQEAFDLTTRIETQIQVADSFKMELSSGHSALDINEIDTCDTSCDELEIMRYPKVTNGIVVITEGVVTATTGILATKANTTTKLRITNLEIDGNTWRETPKITLLHESSHFIPVQFSESSFKQFDAAMKLRKEELKKQCKVEAEVSEVTEEDVARAFRVTKDHMLEAAKILQAEENTENSGHSSA